MNKISSIIRDSPKKERNDELDSDCDYSEEFEVDDFDEGVAAIRVTDGVNISAKVQIGSDTTSEEKVAQSQCKSQPYLTKTAKSEQRSDRLNEGGRDKKHFAELTELELENERRVDKLLEAYNMLPREDDFDFAEPEKKKKGCPKRQTMAGKSNGIMKSKRATKKCLSRGSTTNIDVNRSVSAPTAVQPADIRIMELEEREKALVEAVSMHSILTYTTVYYNCTCAFLANM
jgi:hypothetical protein